MIDRNTFMLKLLARFAAIYAWLVLVSVPAGATPTESGSIVVDGRTRTYRLHIPPGLGDTTPAAVVLAFNGGGSDGRGMERFTGFSRLADREGFTVVYPDAVDGNWVDGREGLHTAAHREGVDDIAFIAALLDELARRRPIDPKRIFATGISNGGIFSHYVAARLADRIAAIAPMAGGLADPFYREFAPARPVSVFIIQGTDDPLMPFAGGGVAFRRGQIIPTGEAVRLWREADQTRAVPVSGDLPDGDPKDGCRVRWSSWRGGRLDSEVLLYVEEGAGHTWPGGSQYLPKAVIGRVCRHFDGTQAIWDFFKTHPRP
jgi:polyhydroxybutyrate depolymerase